MYPFKDLPSISTLASILPGQREKVNHAKGYFRLVVTSEEWSIFGPIFTGHFVGDEKVPPYHLIWLYNATPAIAYIAWGCGPATLNSMASLKGSTVFRTLHTEPQMHLYSPVRMYRGSLGGWPGKWGNCSKATNF